MEAQAQRRVIAAASLHPSARASDARAAALAEALPRFEAATSTRRESTADPEGQ